MLKRSSRIERTVGTQEVKKTVVVVCEGVRTEQQYIEALADDYEVRNVAAVSLRLEAADKGEVPLVLVRRAVDIKKRSEKESAEIDEIWCVFDVEWPQNHPHLREALDLAEANDIHVAVSNPCFELWLILHLDMCTRFLTNVEARRERRLGDAQAGKHLDPSLYMPRRALAVKRAVLLDRKHLSDGTVFPHNNPSSGMYKLIQSVSPPDRNRDIRH